MKISPKCQTWVKVKEYFTYVFCSLIEDEKDYEKLFPSAVAR